MNGGFGHYVKRFFHPYETSEPHHVRVGLCPLGAKGSSEGTNVVSRPVRAVHLAMLSLAVVAAIAVVAALLASPTETESERGTATASLRWEPAGTLTTFEASAAPDFVLDVLLRNVFESAMHLAAEAEHPGPSEEAASDDAVAKRPRFGRFSFPLDAWTSVTDRYFAERPGGVLHAGVDLALNYHPRSRVFSACDGSVRSVGFTRTYGNQIVVDCGGGWSTFYAHLGAIDVTAGDEVTTETVLGISGSTGASTGEHLHFEIRFLGAPVDPELYLNFGVPPGTPRSVGAAATRPVGGSAATATATVTPTTTPARTATADNSRWATPTGPSIHTGFASTATATPAPPSGR